MKFGLMYANAGPFAYPEMLTHLAHDRRAGRRRVDVDGRARRHPGRLQVDLSVRPVGQDPGAGADADPGSAGRARLRGGGDEDAAARDRHPHPAAAPSALRRQGGRDARRAVARPRDPRHRRRLAGGGVRGARHPVRGARRAHGRGGARHALAVEGRGRAVRTASSTAGRSSSRTRSRCRSRACRSSSAATPSSRRGAPRATATASSPASPTTRSSSGCSASCATSAQKLGRDPATIEITSGRAVPDVDGVKRLAGPRRVALHGAAAGVRSRRRHRRASRSSAT